MQKTPTNEGAPPSQTSRNAVPAQGTLHTPDGRYIVVRGRLWRAANPDLDEALRQRLVDGLMQARRTIAVKGRAGDAAAVREARAEVDRNKRSLGERGAVWWTDGAPDFNRHLARNTPYAAWYASVSG